MAEQNIALSRNRNTILFTVKFGDNITINSENKNGQSVPINYTEDMVYVENDFPNRVLVIQVPSDMYHTILNTKSVDGEFKDWFDIELSTYYKQSTGSLYNPIKGGKFKGRLITGDSSKTIATITDSKNKERDSRIGEMNTFQSRSEEMSFLLYRESELSFNNNQPINLCLSQPTVEDVFISAFFKSNSNLKLIFSHFENEEVLDDVFMINNKSFKDIVKLLDDEAGFYNIDYNIFIENDIFYFLNKKDEINCTNTELSTTINFLVSRYGDNKVQDFAGVADLSNLVVVIYENEMKITKEISRTFNTHYNYKKPNGEMIFHNYGVARQTETFNKITNVTPIKQMGDIAYETVVFDLEYKSFNDIITPLTKLVLKNDSVGEQRIYRVKRKCVTITGGGKYKATVEGFRIIH